MRDVAWKNMSEGDHAKLNASKKHGPPQSIK